MTRYILKAIFLKRKHFFKKILSIIIVSHKTVTFHHFF